MDAELNAATRYLVVDLEATCWSGPAPGESEIIEIGAVVYEAARGPFAEYQAFVRPTLQPELSDFCRELTKIRQADVDRAERFPAALEKFVAWARGYELFVLASWGDYDRKQLESDCRLHELAYPFHNHVNLKKEFARLTGSKPSGMKEALGKLGLPLAGAHHRAIDDARNIARILEYMVRPG